MAKKAGPKSRRFEATETGEREAGDWLRDSVKDLAGCAPRMRLPIPGDEHFDWHGVALLHVDDDKCRQVIFGHDESAQASAKRLCEWLGRVIIGVRREHYEKAAAETPIGWLRSIDGIYESRRSEHGETTGVLPIPAHWLPFTA